MDNPEEGVLAGQLDEDSLQYLTINRIQEHKAQGIEKLNKENLQRYVFTLKMRIEALENINDIFLDEENYYDDKDDLMDKYKEAPAHAKDKEDKIDILNEWFKNLLNILNDNDIYYGVRRHYTIEVDEIKKDDPDQKEVEDAEEKKETQKQE